MSGLRILIIDDNEASAKTVGWTLEFHNHTVELALTGEKALEKAKEFKPQLVLCDIGMPGMDGYEICRRMKAMPELKDTVLIAQTGWSQDEHVKKAEEVGFHYHWVKPLEFDTLGETLDKITREHNLNP